MFMNGTKVGSMLVSLPAQPIAINA